MILWPEWVCLGFLKSRKADFMAQALLEPELAKKHKKFFSTIAKRFGMACVAGTVPVHRRGKVELVAFGFDQDGKEVLAQPKWHLSHEEARLGYQPGKTLALASDFPVPGQTCGVLMGRDAMVPEMARLMVMGGAGCLLQGVWDPRPYNSIERMNGIVMRVQENKVFGAKSVLLGQSGQYSSRGNAKVVAVSFATPYRDGVLAQAATNNEEEIVISEINVAKVKEKRQEFDLIGNLNRDYVASHFPFVQAPLVDKRPTATVCAVQLELEFSTTPKQFEKRMDHFVERAKAAGADLAVFPEDMGTCLLGLYLDLPGLVQRYREKHLNPLALLKGDKHLVSRVFQGVSPYALEVYLKTFSELSKRYDINLMAGSILCNEGDEVYNIAHLFDRRGNLVLTQKKMQLFSVERDWDLKAGDDTKVVALDIGRVGIMVCMDTGYPEEGRILAAQGAEILLDCTANPDECHTLENLNGLWARVQDNRVFGVKSCLYGSFANMVLRGKSGIYAPSGLTDDRTGILSEAAFSDADALVQAKLDFSKLRDWQEKERQEEPIRFKDLSLKLAPFYKTKVKA